ncbi:hypothetical protein WNB94_07860 [Aquabacterium sp. A3]|uniref:hypothetical protein n=1 Tax=Aquabacterium sp. A3 TaxID=3132829 RepID=UPI0031196C27
MGIRYLKKHAALEDIVTVEDAEGLFDWLKQQAKPAVNLSKCVHLHAAVLQVLLMVRPKVVGAVNDPLLSQALAHTQA